jgi:uncharacterized phage protein (TIGR01671 family)
MQDRYLFRGKRIDNGEYVIGNRIDDGVTGQVFIHAVGNSVNESDKVGEEGGLQFVAFEVALYTICQCTGLKDKNGTLIWENDIVKHYNDDAHPENYCTGTVLWDENYAGFYRTSNEYGLSKPRISSDCIYEVVGNVFDDPELLEEKYGDMQTQES